MFVHQTVPFPELTGDAELDIKNLHEYTFKLQESLIYTMSNLTLKNFGKGAFGDFEINLLENDGISIGSKSGKLPFEFDSDVDISGAITVAGVKLIEYGKVSVEDGGNYPVVYVKFFDGTAIQFAFNDTFYKSSATKYAGTINLAFPMTDYLAIATPRNDADGHYDNVSASVYGNTSEHFVIRTSRPSSGYLPNVYWLAVGRWK